MNAFFQAYENVRATAKRIVATIRRAALNFIDVLRGLLRTSVKAATGGYGTAGVMLAMVVVLALFVYGPVAFFSLLLSYALTLLFSLAFTAMLDRVFSPQSRLF